MATISGSDSVGTAEAVAPEDVVLLKELRERGKRADDAARFHRGQARVAESVALACSAAVEMLNQRQAEDEVPEKPLERF